MVRTLVATKSQNRVLEYRVNRFAGFTLPRYPLPLTLGRNVP